MSSKELNSWKDAQREIVHILARLNADPSLILAAAANPLLALEELGYEIGPDVRQEFEDRLRFGPDGAAHVSTLRESIYRHAGRPFNLSSTEEVFDVLSSLLRTRRSVKTKLRHADVEPLASRARRLTDIKDPLERFQNAHPIMKPLLQYRRQDASTPRFATQTVYTEIREGKRSLPITRMVAHLKSSSRSHSRGGRWQTRKASK